MYEKRPRDVSELRARPPLAPAPRAHAPQGSHARRPRGAPVQPEGVVAEAVQRGEQRLAAARQRTQRAAQPPPVQR